MTKRFTIALTFGLLAYLGMFYLSQAFTNLFENIAPRSNNLYDSGTATSTWNEFFTNRASTTLTSAANGTATSTLSGNATSTIASGLIVSTGGMTISTMNCGSLGGGGKLTTTATGDVICGADGGGAGGTPGGSDTQVQYNNGGAFGGASNLVYDDVLNFVGIATATPGSLLSIQDVGNFKSGTSTLYQNLLLQNLRATGTLEVNGDIGFSALSSGLVWPVASAGTIPKIGFSSGNDAYYFGTDPDNSTYVALTAADGITLYANTGTDFLGAWLPALELFTLGNVNLTAGGTNQNITLTPSGTGYTLLNGNVGIGTTGPGAALDTKITSTAGQGTLIAQFGSQTSARIRLYDETSTLGPAIDFNAGNVGRITGAGNIAIMPTNNGNVGIGTTSPGSILSVQSVGNFQAPTSTLYTGLTAPGFLATSTGITISGGALRLNSESFTDLTGTGLDNTAGVLTPNCAAITGGAGLCDGVDDTGAGGGGPVNPFDFVLIGGTSHAASSTRPFYFGQGLLAASSTLGYLNVGYLDATSTTASTFTAAPIFSSLTGVLKGNGASALTVAADGTDFSLITALTCSGTDKFSAVTADGTFTCSADTGGAGGSNPFSSLTVGSTVYQATTSPLYFSGGFLTGTSTIGTLTATSTITGLNGLTISGGSVDFPNGSIASADLVASTITFGNGTCTTGSGSTALGGTGTVSVTSNCTDAATLDSVDSLSFLRSDASDAFTSGTLTINSGTTLAVAGTLTVTSSATSTWTSGLFSSAGFDGRFATLRNVLLGDGAATSTLAFDPDGGGQITIATSSTAVVLSGAEKVLWGFNIFNPSPSPNATSTIGLNPKSYPLTATHIVCHILQGTNVVIDLIDGVGNNTNDVTCTTATSTATALTSNNTFTKDEGASIRIISVSGNVVQAIITVKGTITPQ